MVRTIVTYPADVLRTKAKDVENIDGQVVKLAEDMAETMYLSRGVGLAAPQIGESVNLIVVDIGDRLIELFNPKIVSTEDSYVAQEGCLSVPEILVEIERAEKVVVQGIDRDGKDVTLEAQELLARALQHEIDHLNGTLIIDHASGIQRQLIRGKLKKLRREQEARA